MHRLIVSLLLLSSSPATAQTTTAVVPVFSHIVAFPIPQGFVPAFEQAVGDNYINEAVPKGESVQDWTQMVTLTGHRRQISGSAESTAAGFGSSIANRYEQACPDSYDARLMGFPRVTGAAGVFAAFVGCGDTGTGQSEAMMLLVLVGVSDIYTLQWAERGVASGQAPALDFDIWRPRLDTLATARLCDPVPGEAAPYPSCIGN